MHFVLVHGAYHGAWCWDELRAELERGGHASTAVDLPCDDPDAGAERYVDEIIHAIPKHVGSVVMVGHSLAGLSIPIAASRTRTAMTVYVCALLPVPGVSFDAQRADMETEFAPSKPAISHPDGSVSWPEEGAVEIFFPGLQSGGRPRRGTAAAAPVLEGHAGGDAAAPVAPCTGRLHPVYGRPHGVARLCGSRRPAAARRGTDRASGRPLAVPVATPRAGSSPRPSSSALKRGSPRTHGEAAVFVGQ